MQEERQRNSQRLLFAAALVALILPAAIYVYIFGPNLSDSHQRWGEFGSAMSGIYASILALLMLLSAPSWADDSIAHQFQPGFGSEGRHYDRQGGYEGRVDQDGHFYGESGEYQGRVQDGRFYGKNGQYVGREENGRRYDSNGKLLGRQDDTGRMYGADGTYQGRLDKSGRIYDNQGRYEGMIETEKQ